MTVPALTKTRDDSGISPQGYAIGSDDHADLNNLRTWAVAHENATNPHTGSMGTAGGTFTGAISAPSATFETHRYTITNIFFGDAGTEPDVGLYTLAIGGENYYVQTIDIAQNEIICFKVVVPVEYKTGQQIAVRLGFATAGLAVDHTFDSWFGLLDDGDAVDVAINTNTNTGDTVTSGAAANEMTYDETIAITDASGEMNSVAVATGDVIIGKLERTDAGANDFRLISLEISW